MCFTGGDRSSVLIYYARPCLVPESNNFSGVHVLHPRRRDSKKANLIYLWAQARRDLLRRAAVEKGYKEQEMRTATESTGVSSWGSQNWQDSRTRLCVSRKTMETDLREKSLPLLYEKKLPDLKQERHLSQPERYPELQERIKRNIRESLDQSRK